MIAGMVILCPQSIE